MQIHCSCPVCGWGGEGVLPVGYRWSPACNGAWCDLGSPRWAAPKLLPQVLALMRPPHFSTSWAPHLRVSKRWIKLIMLQAVFGVLWQTENLLLDWVICTRCNLCSSEDRCKTLQPSLCKYVFNCCLWRCHKSVLSLFSHPKHLFPFQNIYILLTHSIQLTCHYTVGSCPANIYLASVTTFKQPSQVFNDTGNPSHNSAHLWHPPSAALTVAGLQEPDSLARERDAFLGSVAGICKCHKQSNKWRGLPRVVDRFYLSICAQPPQTYIYDL